MNHVHCAAKRTGQGHDGSIKHPHKDREDTEASVLMNKEKRSYHGGTVLFIKPSKPRHCLPYRAKNAMCSSEGNRDCYHRTLNKFFPCSVLLSYYLSFGYASARSGKEGAVCDPRLEPHLENGRVEGRPRLLGNERLQDPGAFLPSLGRSPPSSHPLTRVAPMTQAGRPPRAGQGHIASGQRRQLRLPGQMVHISRTSTSLKLGALGSYAGSLPDSGRSRQKPVNWSCPGNTASHTGHTCRR